MTMSECSYRCAVSVFAPLSVLTALIHYSAVSMRYDKPFLYSFVIRLPFRCGTWVWPKQNTGVYLSHQPYSHTSFGPSLYWTTQWRSKAKCHPRPTIKAPPFPPLKFAYKNFKWKFMFRANLKV